MISPSKPEPSANYNQAFESIAEEARASFSSTHDVRERALRISRAIIQNSANTIRAIHRGEFERARERLKEVSSLADQVYLLLEEHPAVYYAGYVEDALKEYSEASATLAFAEGSPLAGPSELRVGAASYLNGLAETVGELRRFILDSLRRDDFSRCEELLDVMDGIYSILVTIDYPDAVTRGLRRSTDMARGILERTRGDLTVALRQRRLAAELATLQKALGATQRS